MPQRDFAEATDSISSASVLTEATFLRAGQALEASIEILAALTTRFEAMLADLAGETLGQALKALARTAARVGDPGDERADGLRRFERLRSLTGAIGGRIGHMKTSLKDVDCLAVNAKIAAAHIDAPGTGFDSFAREIGRTLSLTRTSLEAFEAELGVVCQRVSAAHAGQISFANHQRDVARSIAERLSATVAAIARQHQRGARAGREVKQGSARVRERICAAILASQIGDITRQRLEHAGDALGLAAATRDGSAGRPALGADDHQAFVSVTGLVQSAQLADAARDFDRDSGRIAQSLDSLAAEARALRQLGDQAYGPRGDGTFIQELEGQAGEALALFEAFEAAREEVAGVTATVSDAAGRLCAHLRAVRSLEDDIRIMGLNTTFKCARLGREGLALSLIAQELRTYANGFAKEAGTLMSNVETIAAVAAALQDGARASQASESTEAMREGLTTLRRTGENLDVAMAELGHDSERVVALLVAAVADLVARKDIGQKIRDASDRLAVPASDRPDLAGLTPRVQQMLAAMARCYTMTNERMLHDRVLGRSSEEAPVARQPETEDFLF